MTSGLPVDEKTTIEGEFGGSQASPLGQVGEAPRANVPVTLIDVVGEGAGL